MSDAVINHGQYQNLADGTYLPTIKSGYGIKYDIPFIGEQGQINFPYSRTWDYYDKGQAQIMTWFDFSSNAQELANKPNYRYSSDFWSRHETLTEGFNEMPEEELEVLKNQFNSDVSWLWGSLDEGGAFMIKAANDPSDIDGLLYRFYVCWGEFEREEENPDYSDGKYFYYFSAMDGGNRVPLSEVYNVAFYLNGDDDAQSSIFSVYYCTNAEDNRVFWGNVGGVYGMTLPQIATSNPNWISGLGIPEWVETPFAAWYFEGGSDNDAVDVYGYNFEFTKQISGNPFSDDEFGEDPAGGGGLSSGGGGFGIPATDTGDVDGESAADLNLLTAINSGLATLYNPTPQELSNFANWLYTDLDDDIADQLKRLQTNPIDFMLFVALCKFNPPTSGRAEIGFGGFGSGVSAQKISNQFMELDCGIIEYPEQFASFLDFNGKVSIYLPYCGTHELKVDDVMGSRIKVNYIIDLLSGSCLARVKMSRSPRATAPRDARLNDVIYEFQGNVYLTMPISATDWRGTYQALVGLASNIISGASSGGSLGAISGAVTGAADAIMAEKVTVSRSGQPGSAYGHMNNKKPYLILERAIQSVPTNWGRYEGFMSNITTKVGNLAGYTETDPDTVWSENIPCTSAEAEEIKQLFNSGVYL